MEYKMEDGSSKEVDINKEKVHLEIKDNDSGTDSVEVTEIKTDFVTILLEKLGYHDNNITDMPDELTFILSCTDRLTLTEAAEVLKEAVSDHAEDENIPYHQYEDWKRLSTINDLVTNELDVFLCKAYAAMIKFSSPYLEVRTVIDTTDDPSIPVETVRAYFLAIVWSIVGSGFNEFFSHRLITISVSTSVIQIVLNFCGTFWADYFPCWGFNIRGRRIALNVNTPWTKKEQMFSTLLFAISMGTFYTHYNILTLKMKYDVHLGFGYQFLLSLSIQFLGFGFAGILRRFVVYPVKSMWPTVLPTLALNKTLCDRKHKQSKRQYKAFGYSFLFIFFYNWFPTYIINILNTFNWMTWIAPTNVHLANITGGVTGLGFNPVASFDWNVLGNMSPLVVPFWSLVNQYVAAVFAALIVIAVYYTNYAHTQYFPMFTQGIYTNTGEPYSVRKILNEKNELDIAKYQAYSPPFYTAGNLVSYGCFIVCYPLMIVYSMLVHTKLLSSSFKSFGKSVMALRKKESWVNMNSSDGGLSEFHDIHSTMMKKYKEVPDWWYFTILIISVVIGIIVVEVYHTNTPVWGLFVSIGFNAVFLIPVTLLQSIAGISLGLNLLIEMIIGYALPGNPFALMIIKAFGYNIDAQSDNYVSNLKMAHYAKIPPVALFRGQCFIVLLQIFVNMGVLNWQASNIKGFCTPKQTAKFTCPDITTFFNSSIVWGAIGPKRIFNDIYPILRWCWLIGALLGLFFGLMKRYYSKYIPRNFDPVVFVVGMLSFSPPYGLMYFTPSFIVGIISQFYVRRYHVRKWERYNYMIQSGLAAGLVFSAIIIFFAVQYKDTQLSWWGNNVPYAGVDAIGLPLRNVTDLPKGYFGPDPGHYP